MSNKKKTPMGNLTHGHEKFIRNKELSKEGKEAFDKAVASNSLCK